MMRIMLKLSLVIPILLLLYYSYIYIIHVCFCLSLFVEEYDDSLPMYFLCLDPVIISNLVFVGADG